MDNRAQVRGDPWLPVYVVAGGVAGIVFAGMLPDGIGLSRSLIVGLPVGVALALVLVTVERYVNIGGHK